jgi:MFS family permease
MTGSLNGVFSQDQIAAGAWRIPFLIGGVFGVIAMWMRHWLKETPVFEEMRKRATLSRELPLGAVLKNHGRAVAASIFSTWMLTASIVVVILMTPALIGKSFGIAPAQTQLASLAATATLCISTVAIGAATDRFGIRRVAVPILLLLIASTYGLYCGAMTMPFALLPLYALAGVGAGGSVIAPIMMIRAFPASIRFSGVSFSYNLAYALFGGLTPLVVSWLIHFDHIVPAHYVAVATIVGLAAILMAPSHRLSDPYTPPLLDKSCV